MTCLKTFTSTFNIAEWLVRSNLEVKSLRPSPVQKHLAHDSLAAEGAGDLRLPWLQ